MFASDGHSTSDDESWNRRGLEACAAAPSPRRAAAAARRGTAVVQPPLPVEQTLDQLPWWWAEVRALPAARPRPQRRRAVAEWRRSNSRAPPPKAEAEAPPAGRSRAHRWPAPWAPVPYAPCACGYQLPSVRPGAAAGGGLGEAQADLFVFFFSTDTHI